jgi:HlyD family secretion protein
MDIPRQGVAKKKRNRWALILVMIAGVVATASYGVMNLEPAIPSVEAASLWPDTVKRGAIVLDIKGIGTLVPEEIVWIPAKSQGQVDKVLRKSGEKVNRDTVLAVLSNPDMDLEAKDLEWQIKQAEANFADLKVRLQSQRFDYEAATKRSETAMEQAELQMNKKQQLFNMQLEPEMNLRDAVSNWKQTKNTFDAERQKLDILADSQKAQLDSARVQIDKLKDTLARKRQQVRELTIRAGTEGVLQEMNLQPGQRIEPGTLLAKVAQPGALVAQLRISESQAKDVLVGQKAMIDTGSGIVPARVVRIDPNVANGTRTVDCAFEGPLPKSAVPDMTVNGTIELERLESTLYISRPVYGQPNSQVNLFKVSNDGKSAARVPVRLGRASVTTIEVVSGLNEGDRVILSDMSAQDQYSKIELK